MDHNKFNAGGCDDCTSQSSIRLYDMCEGRRYTGLLLLSIAGHDYHEPLPLAYDLTQHSVVLHVGISTDRVWHFWSPSPRALLPEGEIKDCTARARVKISPGALLQLGFDYWCSPTGPYGLGGNNREAGASNWYFPSDQWQEATFSDIREATF